jgi:hypothetical protein
MSSAADIENSPSDRRRQRTSWWSRLRGALQPSDRGVGNQGDASAAVTAPPHDIGSRARTGMVLPFPIHGEALLVKLAEELRSRVAERGPEWDPLLLQMSHWPRSRLSIDRTAYIEFHPDRVEYRAVIEASGETRVILETVDFDALVNFVQLYVVARPAEAAALEAAS